MGGRGLPGGASARGREDDERRPQDERNETAGGMHPRSLRGGRRSGFGKQALFGRLADRLTESRLDPPDQIGTEDPLGHKVERSLRRVVGRPWDPLWEIDE